MVYSPTGQSARTGKGHVWRKWRSDLRFCILCIADTASLGHIHVHRSLIERPTDVGHIQLEQEVSKLISSLCKVLSWVSVVGW